MKLTQFLNFWFQGESLDLQILKTDSKILANNLQNIDMDLKKIKFNGGSTLRTSIIEIIHFYKFAVILNVKINIGIYIILV